MHARLSLAVLLVLQLVWACNSTFTLTSSVIVFTGTSTTTTYLQVYTVNNGPYDVTVSLTAFKSSSVISYDLIKYFTYAGDTYNVPETGIEYTVAYGIVRVSMPGNCPQGISASKCMYLSFADTELGGETSIVLTKST